MEATPSQKSTPPFFFFFVENVFIFGKENRQSYKSVFNFNLEAKKDSKLTSIVIKQCGADISWLGSCTNKLRGS